MQTVLDTNFLIALIAKDKDVKLSSLGDHKPISQTRLRIEAAMDHFDQSGMVAVVPTPAIAELLIKIDPDLHRLVLSFFQSHDIFQIGSFDEVAAIECAMLVSLKEKKQLKAPDATKAKIVADRQIIAIAKAMGCESIHTQDQRLANIAEKAGITPVCLSQYQPLMTETIGMPF